DDAQRLAVAGHGEVEQPFRGELVTERVAGVARDGPAGSDGLEAAGVTVTAHGATREDRHVADLARLTMRSPDEPVAEEQPATDAGRQRDEDAGTQTPGGTVEMLGVTGSVGIVLERHSDAEAPADRRDDGRVDHAGDVGREDHFALGVVERPGGTDADGVHLMAAAEEGPGALRHGIGHVVEARLRSVDLLPVEDDAVLDDRGQDLGATQVDTEADHETRSLCRSEATARASAAMSAS